MATKITTLKGKTSGDDVYPNVLTQNIPDGGVTTAKIADSSITSGKVADGAITTTKIGDGNVTTAKIPDSAITTAKIADDAVTTAKVGTGAITNTKIADDSITKPKIRDGEISPEKFENGWKVLNYEMSDEGVTDYAGLQQWCDDLYQSRGFFRIIYRSGVGFYPIELWRDQDNGEVQFMRLSSTGYVAFGPYIDSDADFNSFMTSYGADVYILRF